MTEPEVGQILRIKKSYGNTWGNVGQLVRVTRIVDSNLFNTRLLSPNQGQYGTTRGNSDFGWNNFISRLDEYFEVIA